MRRLDQILRLLPVAPLLGAAMASENPAWFTPHPHPRPLVTAQAISGSLQTLGVGTEEITVLGRHAPVQPDPYLAAPVEPLRTYEAGASWGSAHPGQFCCGSQYETGLDGQAGR